MMLPKATPRSRLQPRLATEKLTSHIFRHQRIGCLLRNSMATARKIKATSSSAMEVSLDRIAANAQPAAAIAAASSAGIAPVAATSRTLR